MTMLMSQLEAEQMVRNTMLILYQGLNTEIASQNIAWGTRDTAFFTALGRVNPSITVETIESDNFYFGHVPSLIEAPIDRYPNVAVMSPSADPLASTDDHADQYTVRLFVEIMVKATGTTEKLDQAADSAAAELVNARLMRTVQAAHNVLRTPSGRNLNGIVPKVGNQPIVTNGDVFVRKEEKGRGLRWFWQGARMEYRVTQWVNF